MVRVGGGGGLKDPWSLLSEVAQAFNPARRPHVDEAGRVDIGGGGAEDTVETGLGESETMSDLRLGFDRRLGKGGGASTSKLVTPV